MRAVISQQPGRGANCLEPCSEFCKDFAPNQEDYFVWSSAHVSNGRCSFVTIVLDCLLKIYDEGDRVLRVEIVATT